MTQRHEQMIDTIRYVLMEQLGASKHYTASGMLFTVNSMILNGPNRSKGDLQPDAYIANPPDESTDFPAATIPVEVGTIGKDRFPDGNKWPDQRWLWWPYDQAPRWVNAYGSVWERLVCELIIRADASFKIAKVNHA